MLAIFIKAYCDNVLTVKPIFFNKHVLEELSYVPCSQGAQGLIVNTIWGTLGDFKKLLSFSWLGSFCRHIEFKETVYYCVCLQCYFFFEIQSCCIPFSPTFDVGSALQKDLGLIMSHCKIIYRCIL